MKEGDLVKSIIQYLEWSGCIAHRINSGTIRIGGRTIKLAESGTADIVGCLPNGRFFAIELKLDYNKPNIKQLQYLADVEARGGLAIVAYSLQDVETAIRGAM